MKASILRVYSWLGPMQYWICKPRQAWKGAAVANFICAVGCLATFYYQTQPTVFKESDYDKTSLSSDCSALAAQTI